MAVGEDDITGRLRLNRRDDMYDGKEAGKMEGARLLHVTCPRDDDDV